MKLTYDQEKNFVLHCLTGIDVPADHAEIIAKMICHSDFTGVYSHGLSRFTLYMASYLAGGLNRRPDFRVVKDSETAISLDCDNGSGLVSVNLVYDEVLKNSRRAEGVEEILVPGELEFRRYRQNMAEGVEISDKLIAELKGYAVSAGILREDQGIEALF